MPAPTLHFAPGLSDNASVNLESMPKNAYIALYIDSDGPIGAMKQIPRAQQAYFEFLPMFAPYVVKKRPDVFVVQLGGGISSNLALAAGPKSLTVAESNPALLKALTGDGAISRLTGNPLKDGRVRIVPYDGRLYLGGVRNRYDVIDLSLADSTGLSHAGGFAIVEKYNYTRETLQDYMRALKPNGVLAITLWNKEDLPKSVPKLFATVVSAARGLDGDETRNRLFVFHTYLSTVTVLYKKNGFAAAETAALREWSEDMSWELLHVPGSEAAGKAVDAAGAARIWRTYRASHFIVGKAGRGDGPGGTEAAAEGPAPTWQNLYRLMLGHMLDGRFDEVQRNYVFDTRPLTDNRPYFAAYIKPLEIPHFLDQLEAVSDEWGYLLLWATLVIAAIFGFFLMMIPVAAGWRTIFSRQPGKIGIFVYFFCLGAGYITIEVGLIGKFLVALSNPTISATVLITSMLFFSGLGSLASGRFADDCRRVMPRIFLGIGALVAAGAFLFDPVLGAIGQWPYGLRIATCILLVGARGLPDGLSLPDRHDDAVQAGQGALLPVGLGHQRHLLGGRRRRCADRQRAVRPADPAARRRGPLSDRPAGLLQPAQTGAGKDRSRVGEGLKPSPTESAGFSGNEQKPPSLHAASAVDREGDAGDEAGLVARQPEGGLGDILGGAEPAERHRRLEGLARVGAQE